MDTATAIVTVAVTALVLGIPLLGLTLRLSVGPRQAARAGLAYPGAVLRRILRHLHLPELPPPLAPARGPPQQALWD